MRILKLYSDREKFNPIEFNENGFSFICGIELKENHNNTYNGVGKTLSMILIDFCLGSNSQKELSKLKCSFFLDIKINNIIYTLKRDTQNQLNIEISQNNKILFTGLTNVRNFLSKEINIIEKNEITFRSILPYFFRYKNSSFLDPIKNHGKQEPYNSLLNVFYLLGFDLSLIKLKRELKEKIDNLEKALKQIEDPEIKKTLVEENADAKIEIDALKRKLELKEMQIKNFKLAENLSDLKKELYKKRTNLQEILNFIFIHNKKIELINDSLNQSIDIQFNDLKELYGEALIIFPKNSLNDLKDAENFHKKLIENRINKLQYDKNEIQSKLTLKNIEKTKLETEINQIYNLVNQKGDLEEFNTIITQVTTIKEKINKFESYTNLVDKVKREKLSIDQQMSFNNIKAQEYIDLIEKNVKKINEYFTKIINNFYPEEHIGRIVIDVNLIKKNKIQFLIEPKISHDSSTGVSVAKIMCFDTLLLILNTVNIKFLIHDSNIFHGVDINKFSNYLKYLYNTYCKNYQFIFSINQNDINELKLNFSNEEYIKIIKNNIVLELNGKGEKGYLIGEKLELELDEK